MYLHQKMIRIYADIVQNHTLPGVFPNFWRAVYIRVVSDFQVFATCLELLQIRRESKLRDSDKDSDVILWRRLVQQ